MKTWVSALLGLLLGVLLLFVGFYAGVIGMMQLYIERDKSSQLIVMKNCSEVGYHFIDFPEESAGILMECQFAKIGKVRNNEYNRALILNEEIEKKRTKLNGLEK